MSVITRHPPVNTMPLDHLVPQNMTRSSTFSGSTAMAVSAASEEIILSSSSSSTPAADVPMGPSTSSPSSSAKSALSSDTTIPLTPQKPAVASSTTPKSSPSPVHQTQTVSPSPKASSPSPKRLSNPFLSTHLTAPSSDLSTIVSPIVRPAGPAPLSNSPAPLSPNTMTARFNILTSSSASDGRVYARDDLETLAGSGLEHNSTLVRNLSVLIVPEPDVTAQADSEMTDAQPVVGKSLMSEPDEEEADGEKLDVSTISPLEKDASSPMSPDALSPKETVAAAVALAAAVVAVEDTARPLRLSHRLTWSVASEKGYRRMHNLGVVQTPGNRSPTTLSGYPRQSIHPDLEDVHWPPAVSDAGDLLSSWSTLTSSADALAAAESMDSMTASTVSLASSADSNTVDADEELRRVRLRSDSSTSGATSSTFRVMPEGAAGIEETKGNVVKSMVQSLSGTTRLFVLADGHGGVCAARFFVPRIRDALLELMSSHSWDFSIEEDRHKFTQEAGSLFKILDTEYCAMQVAAYRRWVDAGAIHGQRPADDGCTMVVVVVHGDHAVSLNVGDSRAVLVTREQTTNAMEEDGRPAASRWIPVFSTEDHNMAHPGKVWDIHSSGGHFINPNGTLKHVVVSPPEQRRYRPYDELNGARIYRHPTDAVRAVGVSHKRTLNLTATMGDLLFKIEPSILSPIPDIRFISLAADREYVILLATDGVWDHLRVQSSHDDQNHVAVDVIASAVESILPSSSYMPADVLTDRLEGAAKALVLRETDVDVTLPSFVRGAARDVFLRGQIRYDDATALVVYLEPTGGRREEKEGVAAAALV